MNGFLHNIVSYPKAIFSGVKNIKHLRLSSLKRVFSLLGRREKLAIALLLLIAFANLFLSLRNFYYSLTTTAPANGGVYTEGLLGQPTYLNPLLAHTETDLAITKIIFSGLYKYGTKGEILPDLAEGMPIISEDQKQYTINLKRNVKWHNNKPFTADDVVFMLQVLQDPSFKSPLRPLWLSTTVEKLSDFQVKFTTKDVSGPFLHNLTLPILPKNVWGGVEPQNFLLSPANLEATGTGPFAIKEIKKLASGKVQEITLTAFGEYYFGRPRLDSVILKFYDSEEDVINALHSGEISGFGFVPLGSTVYLDKDRQEFEVLNLPLPQYQVIFFNLNNKFLAEDPVRRALAAATDKQLVIRDIFKENALMPTSPLLFTHQNGQGTEVKSFNVEQAKTLLEEAGWKLDPATNLRTKKNTVLELTIATNDFFLNSNAAEKVANMWRNLNIKVNLTVLPTKQLTDTLIRPRSFDVLLFPQKFGADPDPFLFWHSSQVKDPGFNLTGLSSLEADKLITEARTTTNREIREKKYEEFNKLISEKIATIILNQSMYVYAVDKNVKNINLQSIYEPNYRFYDLPNWYIMEKRVWK